MNLKKKSKKNKEKEALTAHETIDSLKNWSKLVNVMKKISSTDIVEDEDYYYFKVYYTGNFTVDDKNETFVSVSYLPLSKEHIFLGVKEYLENNEMCFVFKKK